MSTVRQFLTVVRPSVGFFPDLKLSKYQWTFTKLVMCIDIVRIYFGIANGLILFVFSELSTRHTIMARYCRFTFFMLFFFVFFFFFCICFQSTRWIIVLPTLQISYQLLTIVHSIITARNEIRFWVIIQRNASILTYFQHRPTPVRILKRFIVRNQEPNHRHHVSRVLFF